MQVALPIRAVLWVGFLSGALACGLTVIPVPQASPASPGTPESTSGGITVQAAPLRLIIPPGLGSGASAENLDVVTDQTGAPWDVAPAHLQLTLHGYPLTSGSQVPQIFVYPAPDYAAMNPRAQESIKRLQAILASRSTQTANDSLPTIPFFNAGQVIATQQKLVPFQGGAGLRIVTQYAQDISPINNGGLFYHFEGLTSDGKYYLVAILPINLSILPGDNKPDAPVPAGGLMFPQNDATGQSYENYYNQIAGLINSSTPDQFTPSLTLLDGLIRSISYP